MKSINMPLIKSNSESSGFSGHSEGATGGLVSVGLGEPGHQNGGVSIGALRVAQGMALNESTGGGARKKIRDQGHIDANIPRNYDQTRAENDAILDFLSQEMPRAGGRKEGEGGVHRERGYQHSSSVGLNEDVNSIREILNVQNNDINELFNKLEDYKTAILSLFTIMSKEQLEGVRELFKSRMNGTLDYMIKYSESIREVKSIMQKDKEIETNQNNNSNDKLISPSTTITKLRPESESPNNSGRIRLNEMAPAAAVDDTDVQKQLRDERRKQQDEILRMRDIENRKRNIIIEGIEENFYGEAGDRRIIEDMLRDIGLGHRIQEMETVDRIGRNQTRRRARLIIVTFSDISAAFEIKDKAYRLAHTRFYTVFVRRDLTRQEREEERIKRLNRRRVANGVTDRNSVPANEDRATNSGNDIGTESANEDENADNLDIPLSAEQQDETDEGVRTETETVLDQRTETEGGASNSGNDIGSESVSVTENADNRDIPLSAEQQTEIDEGVRTEIDEDSDSVSDTNTETDTDSDTYYESADEEEGEGDVENEDGRGSRNENEGVNAIEDERENVSASEVENTGNSAESIIQGRDNDSVDTSESESVSATGTASLTTTGTRVEVPVNHENLIDATTSEERRGRDVTNGDNSRRNTRSVSRARRTSGNGNRRKKIETR